MPTYTLPKYGRLEIDRRWLVMPESIGSLDGKRRYAIEGGSIDVYTGRDERSVFAMEFESVAEALDYEPPGFVSVEITGEPLYSGAALAQRLSHRPLPAEGCPPAPLFRYTSCPARAYSSMVRAEDS